MGYKALVIENQTVITELLEQFAYDSEITFQYLNASIGKKGIGYLQLQQYDLIIFDTNLPDLNGIQFMDIIKSKHSYQRILAVTSVSQPLLIQKMIAKGINGIILKDFDLSEIINAIDAILAGINYWGKGVKKIINGDNNNNKPKIDLTKREVEILSLISDGFTNHEIADKLFICCSTVDSHRKNLLLKFNANNTAKLVKIAISQGII